MSVILLQLIFPYSCSPLLLEKLPPSPISGKNRWNRFLKSLSCLFINSFISPNRLKTEIVIETVQAGVPFVSQAHVSQWDWKLISREVIFKPFYLWKWSCCLSDTVHSSIDERCNKIIPLPRKEQPAWHWIVLTRWRLCVFSYCC